MSKQGAWLDKKFFVDQNGICTLDNLSLSKELDADEQKSKDGKNPTNSKGFKAQSLNLSVHYSKFAGMNPLKEFNEWGDRVGKRSGFLIEGKRIGAQAFILDKVSIQTNVINNFGEIVDATISLDFSEDTSFAKAPKPCIEEYVETNEKVDNSNLKGYAPNGAQNSKSAYNVGPSNSAKEAKK